jgi:serine/threonine protein kinase
VQDPKYKTPEVEDDQETTLDQSMLIAREFGIDERYRFKGRIGSGGMGEVYRAVQSGVERDVAIKLLTGDVTEDCEGAQRFFREAKVLSRLEHPNIVKFYAFGISQKGKAYQIVDYLEGETLAARLERGPLSLSEFFRIFIPIADALRYSSAEGIVHRDVKPTNIFLCAVEADVVNPVLIDFGIVAHSRGGEATITRTFALVGSPMYMSPEQCRGDKVDSRSDIYSLGCTMYEALSGTPPFRATGTVDVMFKHLHNTAPLLPAYVGGAAFNSDLSRLIKQCMAKQVDQRPATFSALLSELKDAAQSTPESAVFSASSGASLSKRVWLVALGALVLVIFVILAGSRYARITQGVSEIPSDFEAAQRSEVRKLKKKLDNLEANDNKMDTKQISLRRMDLVKSLSSELTELAQWQKRHRKYRECVKTCEEARPLALTTSEESLYSLQQIASDAHLKLARAESDPKKKRELMSAALLDLSDLMKQSSHRNRLFAQADYFVVLAESGKLQEARVFLANHANEYRMNQSRMFESIPPTIRAMATKLNEAYEVQNDVLSRDDRLLLCDMFLDLCELLKGLGQFTKNEPSLLYAHSWLDRAIRVSSAADTSDEEMADRGRRIAEFDALSAKSAKKYVSPLVGSRHTDRRP